MGNKHLLGLDLGSGSVRALMVDIQSGFVTSASHAWVHPPAPEAGNLAFNFDTGASWRALAETVRDVVQKAGVVAQDVAGIAASSFRHGTVVIDRAGNVMLSASNKDARAAEQGMGLAADRGEELYQLTGRIPSPVFLASRLLWLKENHPDALKKSYAALSISDWAGYMLTGEVAADLSQAGESLLIELKTRKWSKEILSSLELPGYILPKLKESGSYLGKLNKEAASRLGLMAGIPVAVGGADTQCGLLGMGVVNAGQLAVVAGTTTPVQMVIEKPTIDPKMHLWTGLHVIPGFYVLESNAGQMGSSLEWFARIMHSEATNPVAILCAEAAQSLPGANGMISTVGAMIFNASAMSLPIDTLTFTSILAHPGDEGRFDTARAILEGMAYAVRANVEQVTSVSDGILKEIWLGGGISRSALWAQMVSDVLGCRVHVSASSETTALGAAICAGVGAGLFPDLATGAQKLAQISGSLIPGQESTAYQTIYSDWQSLRKERQPADMVAASQFTQLVLEGASATKGGAAATSFHPKIYISAEVDDTSLRKLSEIGDVTYKPYRTEGILLAGDDLVQTLRNYQVFVTEVDIVDAEALLKLPDLRMVIVCRGNPVNIDIEACTLAGVPITNTPARNADAVADLAIGFMLMLIRKLKPASSFLYQPGGEAGDLGRMGQAHEEFLGTELWRKTIGVVGGGAIGRKVIQRLLPFGARLLLFDPYITTEQVILMGAEKVSFERLLSESDIVSLHAGVNDGTLSMMNNHAFDQMKTGAFLINTARAALVAQEALLAALKAGKLGGYATDVFPVEPPASDDPLLAFSNVIATPHMGGNTVEVAAHQGEIIFNELNILLAGGKPKFLLNPKVMDSFTWTGERHMDEIALKSRYQLPGPGATDLDIAVQKSKVDELYSTKKDGEQTVDVEDDNNNNGKVEPMETNDINNIREKLILIMREFTAQIKTDKEMIAFAKGKNVIFSFTVKDINQAFYLSFVDGELEAGLDNPSREPDVKLKMSADTLDGMFTGRINATKAATSGKLSFSGDTGKAMSFIRIQGKMNRLYSEARNKIGDPGDLTILDVIPQVSSAPMPSVVEPSMAKPASSNNTAREKMIAILREFTTSITRDLEMVKFAKGKNVVFLFTIKDLDQSFFLSFVDGMVIASLENPPREPDVKLKMSADTLDGMFTGRINATKAATSGKLSFSGDTGKAMAFIRIQGNMNRLYSEARKITGDPGDLTRISSAILPVDTPQKIAVVGMLPPSHGSDPAKVVVPTVEIKVGDIRDQILMITNELYVKGLITPTGGNISARCDDNQNEVWITPSAIFKGDLRPDMMVRIDLDGRIIGDTEYTASSERRVHCAIYKLRPEITAVIHTHAPYATLMAITGTQFRPISTEAAFLGNIPVVPFIMPGTDELGEEVAKAIGTNGIAALMQNHGLVVAGSSLRRAADMTDAVEVTAHKILTCKMLGIPPAVLPDEIVKSLIEIGSMMA